MKFDYRERDPLSLVSDGMTAVAVAINDDSGKTACSVVFPYRYFPVLNILMRAIIDRLDRRGALPDSWTGKRVSIIGILAGKYEGFKSLSKLLEGAELWGA